MSGLKENDGKAVRMKISTQFLVIFVLAAAAVAAIKTFGTGSWHAKAVRHDEQQQQQQHAQVAAKSDVAVAIVAEEATEDEEDIRDSNLIKFVFGKLDGEEGREGEVVVKLRPEWAPIGVARIKELTADSFWDGCHAFRALRHFMIQLGINGDPQIQQKWRDKHLDDDPVNASNTRGTVSFAMAGKGTRTTQIFFNTVDNSRLDEGGFAPFGDVISGLDVIDRIYVGYKQEPDQGQIQQKGNSYLDEKFPKMSFIKSARFISSTEAS